MDPSEDNAGKVAPEPNSYSPVTLFALLIIVVQILISLATYPFLPEIVPTHWNAAGQVDAYAPKWVNVEYHRWVYGFETPLSHVPA